MALFSEIMVASTLNLMQLHGHVNFWTQTCQSGGACTIPKAVSAPILVEGALARPRDGHLAAFTRTLTASGLKLQLQVLWRADAQPDEHYLTYQANINDAATGRVIAVCSYYERDDYASYFPVGACAGPAEKPAQDADYVVAGASFTRD